MKTISRIWLGAWRSLHNLARDNSGIAATEFAVIVPIMLVLFFGTVEFSSGIAVDRKVTIMTRTLSDLTSQSTSVGDTDMANFFAASAGIMTPYPATPTKATISELYIDPATLVARVQWSKSYQGGTTRAVSSIVTVPAALKVGDTYLIFSEVSYQYVPTIGYVMGKTGVNLSEVSYTRPRQSTCVFYSPAIACTKL
jgi:Flp pilus assembly protein TadG